MTRAALWVGSVFLLCLGAALQAVQAQAKPEGTDVYGVANTFGAMIEYSNDSSHIVLGQSENEKLAAIGVQYQRRLIATRYFVWSYAAEFRPAIVESNPTAKITTVETSPYPGTFTDPPELTARCIAGTIPFSETFTTPPPNPPVTYSGTITTQCSRELTYAQGFSPVGFRINARPHSRLQPTFSTFEGYILSAQPLPIASAGSFNFSFEVGAGFEYYLSKKRSVRLEYQLQHYSNNRTAATNPGVDNGMFKLTYAFGL